MSLTTILGFVTAFLSFLSRTLEYFKTQEIKNTGKDELKKEILEQDTKIQEKQTEIKSIIEDYIYKIDSDDSDEDTDTDDSYFEDEVQANIP